MLFLIFGFSLIIGVHAGQEKLTLSDKIISPSLLELGSWL